MKVIKTANKQQSMKTSEKTDENMIALMKIQAASCSGECYDCDNCGGAVTH